MKQTIALDSRSPVKGATIVVHDGETVTEVGVRPTVNVYGKDAKALRRMQGAAGLLPSPLGSTRRDAKRRAKAYVEQLVGKSLSWKAARKRLKMLGRQERSQ